MDLERVNRQTTKRSRYEAALDEINRSLAAGNLVISELLESYQSGGQYILQLADEAVRMRPDFGVNKWRFQVLEGKSKAFENHKPGHFVLRIAERTEIHDPELGITRKINSRMKDTDAAWRRFKRTGDFNTLRDIYDIRDFELDADGCFTCSWNEALVCAMYHTDAYYADTMAPECILLREVTAASVPAEPEAPQIARRK
jgi:hypothetical protein